MELPKGTIDYGAVNDKGQTGYSVAHEKGHSAILGLLANAGHVEAVFLIACKEGNEDNLRKTLLDRKDIVKSYGAVGFRVACENGNEATVKWFLQECQGVVDFNSKDGWREGTPFIHACAEGHIGVVNLLLEQPDGIIDITAKNFEGKNGFMLACYGKSIL